MALASVIAWLPLLVLPTLTWLLTPSKCPNWALMWLMAGALYLGCKWLTWSTTPAADASIAQHLGYLLIWPGLDAPTFLRPPHGIPRPAPRDWLFALGKLLWGVILIWAVVPALPKSSDFLRAWTGMIGLVFLLHFGLFHLLSLGWRRLGIDARPLMHWPVLAVSVSEFWGQRWNSAFRDLTYRFLFRPWSAHFGGRTAIMFGFLFSGLIHELVISLPARGGYGGPTLFFLMQAVALFLERSSFGRRLGLTKGVRGWSFTMAALLGPIALLFHPPFVRTVVLPFVDWLN